MGWWRARWGPKPAEKALSGDMQGCFADSISRASWGALGQEVLGAQETKLLAAQPNPCPEHGEAGGQVALGKRCPQRASLCL